MNALIRKEARLLLPGAGAVLLMAVLLGFAVEPRGPTIALRSWLLIVTFVASPVLLVVLVLDSFGREISHGTFSQLLSQPVSRERLWWSKTLPLALAVLGLTAVWCLCLSFGPYATSESASHRLDLIKLAFAFALAAYSGGLWTVLLLRQVAAAFWLTILLPFGLMAGTSLVLSDLFGVKAEHVIELAVGLILGGYSVVGYFFARRLFLRAQDVAWTGGNVELPAFGIWSRRQAGTVAAPANGRPRRALFLKELQLHQPLLLMAGVLALLHLGVVLVRHFGGEFAQRPLVVVVLSVFWLLWFVMPLLVGCSAVAEERKLGTLEAQLCLPVKRSRQHFIKLGVALAVGALLGGVMPLVFEWKMLMRPVVEPSGLAAAFGWFGLAYELMTLVARCLPALILLLAATSVCALSFYVSTLTRSTLQGLAPAVACCIVTWVLLLIGWQTGEQFNLGLWRGPIACFVVGPVMVATLYALSRANFKHVLVGWRVVARNFLLVGVALMAAAALTSAVYHRAWEVFCDFKVTRGPARLEQREVHNWAVGQLQAHVHLNDGRVWAALPTKDWLRHAGVLLGMAPSFEAGRFLEATNWASVSVSSLMSAGVRRDGTLWVAEQSGRGPAGGFPSLQTMIRYGTGENWASVSVRGGGDLLLLSQDGSLWGMGTNRLASTRKRQVLTNFTAQRFGTDSDWAEMSSVGWGKALRKRNGTTWHSSYGKNSGVEVIRLAERTDVYRATAFDGVKLDQTLWVAELATGGVLIGVGEDGALRAVGRWQLSTNQATQRQEYQLAASRDQIGTDTNWVALAGNTSNFIALKTNGTLWRWNLTSGEAAWLAQAKPARFDSHSDWVGLVVAEDGVAALAADGSIWFWRLESRYQGSQGTRLLAPSRRPELVANMFGGSN
jgi:ABC-type transport system involved in multi-copper enzyme maturation permease subunit